MECKTIQESLSAYIDGALPPKEKDLVEEHLRLCRVCSETLGDLKKTVEQVRQIEEVEPPPWLAQKVMARVRSEVPPEKGIIQKIFYPLHIKLPIGACVAVLIAVTTIYIYKTMQPEMKLAKAPPEETMRSETPSPAMPRDEVSVPSKAPEVVIAQKDEPAPRSSLKKRKSFAPGEEDEALGFRESKPVPAKPAEQAMPAEKPETADKYAEPAKTAAPAMKPGAAPSAGTVAKEEIRREAVSVETKLKALTSGEVYRQGDNVYVTVTNISDHNVEIVDRQFIDSGFAKVEKKDDKGEWEKIELFAVANVIVSRTLKPRESHVYIWRTAGYNRNDTTAAPGIYRIDLGDQTYTNDFEIKDKQSH